MPLLHSLVGIRVAILFWVRVYGIVKGLQAVDRDTKGLQRRAVLIFEDIGGTRLQRVCDPRLAATILMIQIVRTGSPLTANDKTRILAFMETPLEIERISATLERAGGYTQASLPFSRVSDQVIPLMRETLTPDERTQLVEMLTQVAGAHSAPSELQREGIARLRRRLLTNQVQALDARRGRSASPLGSPRPLLFDGSSNAEGRCARTPRRSSGDPRRATCVACARCCLF